MKLITYGNQLIGEEEVDAVSSLLREHKLFRYSEGLPVISKAENSLGNFLLTKNTILLANGTAALKASLMALGPNPGDLVLIPALTFVATATAVLASGLIPVLVDVDDSGQMSFDSMQDVMRGLPRKPLAVIMVHLDGMSGDVAKMAAYCKDQEIYLIEDVAQAFGAKFQNKFLGTYGDFGCFSFQQNKILSVGEGGALVSNDDSLFSRAKQYSDFGFTRKVNGYPETEFSSMYGENYKASNIIMEILEQQFLKYNNLVNSLEEFRKCLIEYLEEYDLLGRHDGSLPISICTEDSRLIDRVKNENLPYIEWSKWSMMDHPVIAKRLSPYSNGFPWNLKEFECSSNYARALEISKKRVSLQVSINKNDQERIRKIFGK